METGRIELLSRISIGKLLLKSPMLYPSPTGTLQLHCKQFWTFIVYANAHAQCDVQHTHTHTHTQAELYRDDRAMIAYASFAQHSDSESAKYKW